MTHEREREKVFPEPTGLEPQSPLIQDPWFPVASMPVRTYNAFINDSTATFRAPDCAALSVLQELVLSLDTDVEPRSAMAVYPAAYLVCSRHG